MESGYAISCGLVDELVHVIDMAMHVSIGEETHQTGSGGQSTRPKRLFGMRSLWRGRGLPVWPLVKDSASAHCVMAHFGIPHIFIGGRPTYVPCAASARHG